MPVPQKPAQRSASILTDYCSPPQFGPDPASAGTHPAGGSVPNQQPLLWSGGGGKTGGCETTASGYIKAMILEKFPEVQQLSASEKLIFVSELWNDLEAHPSEVPVSREIIAELDRRMEHFRQHPDEFTTWETVKGRILGSRP